MLKDRPGHDFRYSVNYNKIKKKFNWKPKVNFRNGLKQTVKWYADKIKKDNLNENLRFRCQRSIRKSYIVKHLKKKSIFFFSSSLKRKPFLNGNLINTKILLNKIKN